MKIRQITSGPIATNAFLAAADGSNDAIIFDAPPDVTPMIQQVVSDEGMNPVLLVITHAHWDHIGAARELVDLFSIPLAAHPASVEQLEHPRGGPDPIDPVSVDRLLNDSDTVTVGGMSFDVLHTPGHAKGQISLYSVAERVMFGGDTLFPNGYGRTDIPGASDEETLATMIRLLELPDDVTVYPGHGESTTIGRERPWMTRITRGAR